MSFITSFSSLCSSLISQTPNCILSMDDVPKAERSMRPEVAYPADARYTLQVLKKPGRYSGWGFDNNTDAAFVENSGHPKPSSRLLAYHYGAAAVHRWGHNWREFLSKSNRPDLPQPKVIPPPRVPRERNMDDVENYDIFDFMLRLTVNSPYARERRRVAEEEANERINTWIDQVSP